MTIERRISDSIAALGTCSTLDDLRDVWRNVWNHWSGGVPQRVAAEKDRIKRRLQDGRKR